MFRTSGSNEIRSTQEEEEEEYIWDVFLVPLLFFLDFDFLRPRCCCFLVEEGPRPILFPSLLYPCFLYTEAN